MPATWQHRNQLKWSTESIWRKYNVIGGNSAVFSLEVRGRKTTCRNQYPHKFATGIRSSFLYLQVKLNYCIYKSNWFAWTSSGPLFVICWDTRIFLEYLRSHRLQGLPNAHPHFQAYPRKLLLLRPILKNYDSQRCRRTWTEALIQR